MRITGGSSSRSRPLPVLESDPIPEVALRAFVGIVVLVSSLRWLPLLLVWSCAGGVSRAPGGATAAGVAEDRSSARTDADAEGGEAPDTSPTPSSPPREPVQATSDARAPSPTPPTPASSPPPPPLSSDLPEPPSRDDIRRAFEGARDAVRACVDNVPGSYVCRITISGTRGLVSAARVVGGASATNAACIRRVLLGLRFPPFARPQLVVSYTYRFDPAEADAALTQEDCGCET
jgi:hypothetical protein